jgi:hypothetical protein
MHSGKLVYLNTVAGLLADAGCELSDAYTRCLAYIDSSAFVPNSELMLEVAISMLAQPAATAHRFKRHSEHETAGAEILQRVANRNACAAWRPLLLAHARDEFKHGRMFAGFCSKISRASGIATPSIGRLDTDSHARAFDGNMANFMIATHVAELRSLALLKHYEEGAKTAPPPLRLLLPKLLATVTSDERRHVTYTGMLVSALVADSQVSEAAFRGYVDVYNRDTWMEISVIASLLGGAEAPCGGLSASA